MKVCARQRVKRGQPCSILYKLGSFVRDRIDRCTSPLCRRTTGRPWLMLGRVVPSVSLAWGPTRRGQPAPEMERRKSGPPMSMKKFDGSGQQEMSHPRREENIKFPYHDEGVLALETPRLTRGGEWWCRTHLVIMRRWSPSFDH